MGKWLFPSGYYVYTGRDKNGGGARIRHHRNKVKKCRWHIDYLTLSRYAEVIEWVRHPGSADDECRINRCFLRRSCAGITVPGFGASDCRDGCGSHLVFFEQKPEMNLHDI